MWFLSQSERGKNVGHKVNPIGFRIGYFRKWNSRWFARDSYADYALEDIRIRSYIKKKLPGAEIGRVEIDKAGESVKVVIFSARPGVVIGKKGQKIEDVRSELSRILGRGRTVDLKVQEIATPEASAQILADNIADQIERRVNYKKAMKKVIASAARSGVKGVKVRVAGRLGGAEIARCEVASVGSMPLHTLRSDIDFAIARAYTMYGVIGIKVWICKGESNTS
jgi:small subunit ribosomal protein S3